jgi:hypothetical protein
LADGAHFFSVARQAMQRRFHLRLTWGRSRQVPYRLGDIGKSSLFASVSEVRARSHDAARSSRRQRQRHIGGRRRIRAFLPPASGIAANRGVTASVSKSPQRLVDQDRRQPLTRRLAVILHKKWIKPIAPRRTLRLGLHLSFAMKLRRLRSDNLPAHFPRQTQSAPNRLDRHPLGEISPTNFSDRLHPQHLELGLPKNRRPVRALISGVNADSYSMPITGIKTAEQDRSTCAPLSTPRQAGSLPEAAII